MNLLSKIITLLERIEDSQALQKIAPLVTDYIPWSKSAMRPRALEIVLNDILLNRHRNIIECGGGISTIIISQMLSKLGEGHLYTIEDNKSWSEELNAILDERDIGSRSTIIYAAPIPLSEDDETTWYDKNILQRELRDSKINLLLIDGPVAHKKEIEMARYPAVPFFQNRLLGDYTVFLDDIQRKGERTIIQKWGEILNQPYHIGKIGGGNLGMISTGKWNVL